MATESGFVYDETFKSTGDLSAKQFFNVKIDTANARSVVIAAAATDRCVGVLQNNPTATHAADVRMLGMTKAVTDGSGTAISIGDLVGTDSTGRMVKKATADYNVGGIALEASSALGTVISVILLPMSVFRTLAG